MGPSWVSDVSGVAGAIISLFSLDSIDYSADQCSVYLSTNLGDDE